MYIEIDGNRHKIGESECPQCWSGYPKKCTCGGLVHAEFGDENWEGDYWIYKECDKCGKNYMEED